MRSMQDPSSRMGWRHQAGHAYRHLIERLERFGDELPETVVIAMEDSEGRVYVENFAKTPPGESFVETLRREIDAARGDEL